jgi:hypothetical protein
MLLMGWSSYTMEGCARSRSNSDPSRMRFRAQEIAPTIGWIAAELKSGSFRIPIIYEGDPRKGTNARYAHLCSSSFYL